MSIVILGLGSEHGDTTSAQVRHEHHVFEALIHGKRASLAELVNVECLVEMAFNEVTAWVELEEFDDESSCIKASESKCGGITVRGRVHSAIEVSPGAQIIDLYLRNGPEFLSISSEELGGFIPSIGAALEVNVNGLRFYLSKT